MAILPFVALWDKAQRWATCQTAQETMKPNLAKLQKIDNNFYFGQQKLGFAFQLRVATSCPPCKLGALL
jgi:hypothetical protein